jgi:hypothetical protein
MLHTKLTRAGLPIASVCAALSFGCTDDGASTGDIGDATECGGHGELHGDHCDCDPGYEYPDGDELTCVANDGNGGNNDDDDDDDGNDDDGDDPDACDIVGNIGLDALPGHGSVAFVIVDGEYQFIHMPGMTDTSISFIDSDCAYAYGWSRDKPFDDDSAVETSWVLELATMEFTPITIPGAVWTVLRNGRDDGTVVGKLGFDNGTPGDPSDDSSRGFIHDLATGDTQLVAREGFYDIGFTAINDAGTVVGFNNFGMQGFAYVDEEFVDLNHDDAYRLFPFSISASGIIVGFWGLSEDSWYDNTGNPSFIAEPSGDGWVVSQYTLDGYSGTGLTGINDSGQIAGIAYASSTSLPAVFHADGVDASPVFHPLTSALSPFATGISATGLVHGQAWIVQEPVECGGHGTLDGDMCVCDDGFELDPVDPTHCLPPAAECSGHGHLHGNSCHCDSGYEQAPDDPTQCVPA